MNSLVSVVVVTYNAARFIEEALESVAKQEWDNLELVITDDGSEDDTLKICCNWLEKNDNSKRFSRIEIIESDVNTGVPKNANRGLYAARGEWIKYVAGDDTLKQNSIADDMNFVRSNPEAKVLFSKIELYRDSIVAENMIKTIPVDVFNPNSIMAPGRSADSQYRMLLLHDRINYSPSFFIHRESLLEVGGFDERFRLLEDYPLWLNLTKSGYKLFFMDKVTVNYRRHEESLYKGGSRYIIEPNYFTEEYFRRIYTYPNMPVDVRLSERFKWYASQIFRWKWINRGKTVNRVLMLLLTVYLNPFRYYIFLKKQFRKDLKKNELYN
jgi:alpha-1,3-rhamnosyltransferase